MHHPAGRDQDEVALFIGHDAIMLRARTSVVPHVCTTGTPTVGCSNSSSSEAAGESKPEAYPRGYVEDFDEPRTKLAGCFSILLGHILSKQLIPLLPFAMSAVGVDVLRPAD